MREFGDSQLIAVGYVVDPFELSNKEDDHWLESRSNDFGAGSLLLAIVGVVRIVDECALRFAPIFALLYDLSM